MNDAVDTLTENAEQTVTTVTNSLQHMTWEKLVALVTFLIRPLLLFLLCRIVAKIIMHIVDKLFAHSKLEAGIQGFLRSALRIGLWVLTVIFVMDALNIPTASLVALLSVASLALSLSMQNILTNAFSGITVLMSKPFVVGDFVEITGVSGTIKEITLMRTTLDTVDNRIIQIPNSDVATAKIINYSTEPLRRVDLKFSASYDAPTELVKKALMEAIQSDPRIHTDPAPFVALNQYNANDIEYVTRSWVDSADYWGVYYQLNETVREVFAKYGIEFSYPHTVVHLNQ